MADSIVGDFYIETDVEFDDELDDYPNVIAIRRKADSVMFKLRFA